MRRTEIMLPEAEIVFLDEIFKSNSAILNSLLGILNERRFFTGSTTIQVPLGSLYGATNEIPNDEALAALFDRFLIRAMSENLDSFHFLALLDRGIQAEVAQASGADERIAAAGLARPRSAGSTAAWTSLLRFPEEFLARYKGLLFQIRAEGVSVSDRRAVKLLKLFAANALLDGRDRGQRRATSSCSSTSGTASTRRRCSRTSSDRCSSGTTASTPTQRRLGAASVDLDAVLAELGVIRALLLGGETLSDVQLFSQLRNLQDIRAALSTLRDRDRPPDGGRGGPAPRGRLRVVAMDRADRPARPGAAPPAAAPAAAGLLRDPGPGRDRRLCRRGARLASLFSVDFKLERALTHGFHSYAGKLHPSIARGAIGRFTPPGATVLDPVLRQRHRAGGGAGGRAAGHRHRRQPAGGADRPGSHARRLPEGWRRDLVDQGPAHRHRSGRDRPGSRIRPRVPRWASEVSSSRFHPHVALELFALRAGDGDAGGRSARARRCGCACPRCW